MVQIRTDPVTNLTLELRRAELLRNAHAVAFRVCQLLDGCHGARDGRHQRVTVPIRSRLALGTTSLIRCQCLILVLFDCGLLASWLVVNPMVREAHRNRFLWVNLRSCVLLAIDRTLRRELQHIFLLATGCARTRWLRQPSTCQLVKMLPVLLPDGGRLGQVAADHVTATLDLMLQLTALDARFVD